MGNSYDGFGRERSNNCPQTTSPSEIISNNIKALENNLCDMKVTLAETKAALLFLAQTLCNDGVLFDMEKTLLLNLDQSLKCLNLKINESKGNVECITRFLG